MSESVVQALIAGVFSILSALASTWLQEHLRNRRVESAPSETSPAPTGPALEATPTSWRRPATIVVASCLLGLLTRSLRSVLDVGGLHVEVVLALAVMLTAVVLLARFHGRRGWQLGFELENLALWAGFASGWSLLHGGVWSDLLGLVGPFWLGSALVGGLLVAVEARERAARSAA